MAIEQFNLFDFSEKNYTIKKPIRLIELFAGIGAQAKSLEVLGVPFESWKICEWAKPSIKAYKQIHDYNRFVCGVNIYNKQDLIERLKGISSNYNEPMSNKQLERLSFEELQELYECVIMNNNLIDISNVQGADLDIEHTNIYEYVLTYSFPCQDLSLCGKLAGCEEGSGTRSSLLWEVERILHECQEKPQVLIMENVDMILSAKFKNNFLKWCEILEQMGYANYYQVLNAKDYGIPQNRKRCFMVSILGKENTFSFPHKMKLNYKLKDFLEPKVSKKYYLSEKMINYISQTGTENFHNADCKINLDVARPLTTEQNKRAGTTNYIGDGLGDNYNLSKRQKTIKFSTFQVAMITQDGNIKRYINSDKIDEFKEGQVADISFPNGYNKAKRTHDNCPAINTTTTESSFIFKESQMPLKIRKLTPKECTRLMGFQTSDYEKLAKIQTDSQIYHEMGDSICVTILVAIFGKLLGMDYKTIVENYIEELINGKDIPNPYCK